MLQSISANVNLSINPNITIVQIQKRGLATGDWVSAHNGRSIYHNPQTMIYLEKSC
ncbi:MAG: hypothetical protein KME55_13010 [Nostoc indistinguendum CM1-VF10]|nr:hypothetical protein [Nostoc indistinguendum CM1-VF10]